MDADTFNVRINAETTLAFQQALDAIASLESDLKDARIALINARAGRSYSRTHLSAYGNRYLAVPKALSRADAFFEVQTAARELDTPAA